MKYLVFLSSLLLLLCSCVPASSTATDDLALSSSQKESFQYLMTPFERDLRELGISLGDYESYEYRGSSQDGFTQAVNTFYRDNPGFCPLGNAFYASETGLQFMTLAAKGIDVRGFLYDQSRRPALSYAYFDGVAETAQAVIVCETVGE